MNKGFVFIREVDRLGRIVIPKDMRVRYGMDCGEKIKISIHPEGVLLQPLEEKINEAEKQ